MPFSSRCQVSSVKAGQPQKSRPSGCCLPNDKRHGGRAAGGRRRSPVCAHHHRKHHLSFTACLLYSLFTTALQGKRTTRCDAMRLSKAQRGRRERARRRGGRGRRGRWGGTQGGHGAVTRYCLLLTLTKSGLIITCRDKNNNLSKAPL